MLVYLRPSYGGGRKIVYIPVNIWNLLWISGEQTSIYISLSAFPNSQPSNFDKCDLDPMRSHLHNSEAKNTLVAKQSTLFSRKIVNRYKYHGT